MNCAVCKYPIPHDGAKCERCGYTDRPAPQEKEGK